MQRVCVAYENLLESRKDQRNGVKPDYFTWLFTWSRLDYLRPVDPCAGD